MVQLKYFAGFIAVGALLWVTFACQEKAQTEPIIDDEDEDLPPTEEVEQFSDTAVILLTVVVLLILSFAKYLKYRAD
jgi:hypothetical protein